MSAPRDAGHGRQARDAVEFGHDFGRVLSNGRIVGRAEPFAKVFPSSRDVKRAVGLIAWGILEDIALDARPDHRGRLVAETNVRRIAGNLGLNKDTVTRHLGRLREFGFVLHEESRQHSGRYEVSQYVLDQSACIERFTTTPPPHARREDGGQVVEQVTRALAEQFGMPDDDEPVGSRSVPCPRSSDTVKTVERDGPRGRGPSHAVPRPKSSDTVRPVSDETGHGGLGQKNKKVVVQEEEQQPTSQRVRTESGDDGERSRLVARLQELEVSEEAVADLVANHPPGCVRDALDAVETQDVHSPAGWVVTAVRQGWDVSHLAADVRAERDQRRRRAQREAAEARAAETERRRTDRMDGWVAALSAALDDQQLAEAVERITTPLPVVGRRSAPAATAQLVSWCLAVHRDHPDRPLNRALAEDLERGPSSESPPVPDDEEVPQPPQPPRQTRPLVERVAALLTEPDGLRRTQPRRGAPPSPTPTGAG